MAIASKTTRGKNIWVELTGMKEVTKNLQLTKDQKANLKAFLLEEANKLKNMARRLVPVDTGRLKDSHRVLRGRVGTKKTEIRVSVAAGGKSVRGRMVNYAAAVHEGYKHAKSGKQYPGRPWLEIALKMFSLGFMRRFKNKVKIYGTHGAK